MKEIRSRGKRIDNGKWVYGYYLPWHAVTDIVGNEPYAQIFEEYKENGKYIAKGWAKVLFNSVSEYTGLTDKNGKEIYEGDIVRFSHPAFGKDYIGVVKWDENEVGFLCSINCYEMDNGLAFGGDFVEIIGNLWDNPELLEDNQ